MKRLFCVLALAASGCSTSADDSTATRAANVERVTQEQLGIGQNELSLLLDAAPGSVYAANSVAMEQRKRALDALESAGYVTVRRSGGEQGFLSVERTKAGEELASIFLRRP
jgi:hypothetical protein